MHKIATITAGKDWASRALLAASAGIPEQVTAPDYYFSAFNTPFWIWAFRILLLLGAAYVLFAYRYLSKTTKSSDEQPADKEKD